MSMWAGSSWGKWEGGHAPTLQFGHKMRHGGGSPGSAPLLPHKPPDPRAALLLLVMLDSM